MLVVLVFSLALNLLGPLGIQLESEKTRGHPDTFRELVDEILNVVLFVFIGLEVLALIFIQEYLLGGLRGGISVALVAVTYAVVIFSILVQGLTIGPLIRSIK